MDREEEFDKKQNEIRQTSNTAQAVFQEKMTEMIATAGSGGKDIREIQFPIALSGSLNFSKLPIAIKLVLSKIKKLSFVPGEITDIQGWVDIRQLVELNLNRQLITDLGLSGMKGTLSWKVLNLEGNGIREIKWGHFLGLVNVNLSYNRLVRMGVLPRTLEILDVRNNRLELLDLSHGTNLRYINSSNNTSGLVVIPPPRENTDYELIQTSTSPYLAPSTPVQEEDGSEKGEEKDEEKKESEKKESKRESIIRTVDYREGLKEYFRYRAQYEQKTTQEKRDLWKKYRFGKKGSLSLARQMLSRHVPTCLNCQQPGGMIFQFLPEEKKYKGLCGASHPCNFRIEVFRSGEYMRLVDIIEEEQKYSEECKQDLITKKQEIFFGYVDELSGLKKSKEILEECEETSKHVRFLEREYEKLYDSERRRRIDELTLQIGQWITQNKVLISPETVAGAVSDILAGRSSRSRSLRGTDWEEEVEEEEERGREEERLRMVVETEVCQLFPLVQKLRKETYDTMIIETDEEKGGCSLIQEKIAFSQGEYNLAVEPPAVVAFTN
jgi:ribosomal protein L12E/L44/L45/RPP1/RPP2